MKSILQDKKECWACKTTLNLHEHHIFGGTANRKKSESNGLKIYLCAYHHNMSNVGVHNNKEFDKKLKALAQRKFERLYGHEKFMSIFHKNYI